MHTDFLIIGSGIAGLSLALKLSTLGSVTVLTKKNILSGSTGWAQGGIAGVKDAPEDSPENHFHDTMKAGAFHNDESAVRLVVDYGKRALEDLQDWGVKFDFSLHREGGHTYARIFHIADETGRVVQEVLADEVKKNTSITIIENAFAVDLLVRDGAVHGVAFFAEGKNQICRAHKTILATGGAGQVFAKTTNPRIITGDGMAMAFRAGAQLGDMEFVQFHPTALDADRDPMFLLSEALRGAGAKIVNEDDDRFVDELLPRDQVARAIFAQQQMGKRVFLDFRHETPEKLGEKFPMICESLRSFGLSLADDLIPVTPAAHFFCGGVQTDLWGRTSLKNLFAVGEVAHTGLHGANRLASNSLLEGVVFAHRIFEHCGGEEIAQMRVEHFDPIVFFPNTERDEEIRSQIQETMQSYVGVVRSADSLQTALRILGQLDPEGTEIKNLLLVSQQVVTAALRRTTSLGCHTME